MLLEISLLCGLSSFFVMKIQLLWLRLMELLSEREMLEENVIR